MREEGVQVKDAGLHELQELEGLGGDIDPHQDDENIRGEDPRREDGGGDGQGKVGRNKVVRLPRLFSSALNLRTRSTEFVRQQ